MIILPGELAQHQADAESTMTLTLSAYRPNGTTTDANGRKVIAYALVPYAAGSPGTPGKAQSGSQAGSDTATRYLPIGGVQRPVLSGGLHIPLRAPLPASGEQRGIGWEYEVDAVAGGADPALIGRRYLVVGVPAKSFATARRLNVIEL